MVGGVGGGIRDLANKDWDLANKGWDCGVRLTKGEDIRADRPEFFDVFGAFRFSERVFRSVKAASNALIFGACGGLFSCVIA